MRQLAQPAVSNIFIPAATDTAAAAALLLDVEVVAAVVLDVVAVAPAAAPLVYDGSL